jgi:23S rRNA (uridine2552-2'-O)-methyltransferase
VARYNRQDRFFKKAKQEKFAARSIYKLEELDRRFHLFRPQGRVVDLGCAPGSWLQYIAARVGPRGLVLGYDLAAVTVSAGPQVRIFQVDVLAMTPEQVRADAGLEPAVAEIGDRGAREAEPVSGGEALPAEGGEPTRGAREAEPAPAEGRGSKQGGFDALVSDMAPKLSGIRDASPP